MSYFIQKLDWLHSKMALSPHNKEKGMEVVEKFFVDCNPFVFKYQGTTYDIDTKDDIKLDLPFKKISIEMLDGHVCIPNPQVNAEDNTFISLILCHEVEPNKVDFLVMGKAGDHKPTMFTLYHNEPNSDMREAYNSINTIVESFLGRLKHELVGVLKPKDKIKIGTGKGKRHIKLKPFFYIAPKKYKPEELDCITIPHQLGKIEWTHAFEVRGHWRERPGRIGKDREGNYCVNGKTWVNPYVKGPEEMEPIKKTRVVVDTTNDMPTILGCLM